MTSLPHDPFDLFARWFEEASASEPNDANAMSLATADADGRPSVRIVLLKDVDPRGFTFYTNTLSRKGRELAANPQAHLNFHWKSLRRQVRIDGAVEPVTPAEADAYFAVRPRASQIGAWASFQSEPLDDRATLEARVGEFTAKYEGGDVPRPPHWSGYRVVPARMEFWVDRRDRLHERTIYDCGSSGWTRSMQYP
ncbi:pyridoxamine 5'-phosphate oxidase [Sphingosinicella soli]|uniref:Pyridoxine/pyridoxamine 5'-phosphate oxidase n=1 Tax=Sphingosinicella soli TaxID=333708 RepID=A0A7W7F8H5_9SPHN|nr:pyridoxamine 5'-phosphate oxidase [Sphingosinicella soli]MBB4633724.1 pyridoxamine 5'-phosphate oxidase [Sphingosinicella soli]